MLSPQKFDVDHPLLGNEELLERSIMLLQLLTLDTPVLEALGALLDISAIRLPPGFGDADSRELTFQVLQTVAL